ncbi:trigger factor [PVC group bacterium (ex Bugula neritina AB1)]|nr:trigger factor [PVC group bacterium (ex Bugula neritina AB1)]
MNVFVEQVSPCKKRVSVDFEHEDVKDVLNHVLGSFSKNAQLPGFRKGKVPLSMVEKCFKKELDQECKTHLFRETYPDIIQKNELEPLFDPIVEEFSLEANSPMKLVFLIEEKPDFDLVKYKNLELKKNEYICTDDFFEKNFRRVLFSNFEFKRREEEEEAVVVDGDFCHLSYTILLDDEEILKRERYGFFVGEKSDFRSEGWHVDCDGMSIPVAGLKVGQEETFDVTLPEDSFDEKYAGQKAKLQLLVTDIFFKDDLDEFLQENDENKDLESFRQNVKEQTVDMFARQTMEALDATVFEELLRLNPLEFVPESLVQNWEILLMRKRMNDMLKEGQDMKNVELQLSKSKDYFHEKAEEMAKIDLLIEKIVEEEDISLSEDELIDYARRMKKEGDRQGYEDFYEGHPEEKILIELRQKLLRGLSQEKVLSFVKEQATVVSENKEIS